MTPLTYTIDKSIFTRFPGYLRGVVIAETMNNGPSDAELIALLREAETHVRLRMNLEHLAEDARIAAWRETYRSMGVKPSEFRPSNEAMLRRVLHGQELPSINKLVDIGNLISIKHVMPVGSHATDVMKENITLGPAEGDEDFVAFGSEEHEHPDKGEIVFQEGKTLLTRRWIWRQAKHTLTLPESTAVEINLDGLPPISFDDVKFAALEMMELGRRFCGGEMRLDFLTEDHPTVILREG